MAVTTPPMTLGQWADVIFNRNLAEVVRALYDRGMREFDQIGKVSPTDRWTFESQPVQGIAKPTENYDLEALPQRSPVKGYKSTIRQASYRGQITVEETGWRTGVNSQPYDNLADIVDSIKALKDQTTVNFFNNGFTDSLSTNITEADGTARAPFSTGHFYEDGSGTFSNYNNVLVPPNPDTVYTMINQYLRRQKDNVGAYISWGNEFIIVTPTANAAFGMAADEVVQSVDRPDTANRATNVLKSVRLRHVSLNYLTSTTKWFLIVPPSHRAYPLNVLEMIANEVTPLEKLGPQNPHAFVQTARTQFGVGWKYSYRGITAIGT